MNNILPLLAVINGEQLLNVLWIITVWGIIFWVLSWGLNRINPPEPYKKVCTVVLVVLTVLVLINILLELIGHPLIKW